MFLPAPDRLRRRPATSRTTELYRSSRFSQRFSAADLDPAPGAKRRLPPAARKFHPWFRTCLGLPPGAEADGGTIDAPGSLWTKSCGRALPGSRWSADGRLRAGREDPLPASPDHPGEFRPAGPPAAFSTPSSLWPRSKIATAHRSPLRRAFWPTRHSRSNPATESGHRKITITSFADACRCAVPSNARSTCLLFVWHYRWESIASPRWRSAWA